jgi:hypothetical protein
VCVRIQDHIRPCQAIAAAIRADLDFLAVDLSDLPARHRNLRAVFEQSRQTLTPAEQILSAAFPSCTVPSAAKPPQRLPARRCRC